jgi:hypothetical protein
MKTELARGDRLLRNLPELSGIGAREYGYRVAAPEEVAVAKSVISGRGGSPTRRNWIAEMAERLRQRRGEYASWKRATAGGPLGLSRVDKKVVHMDALSKLTEFAMTLQHAANDLTEFADQTGKRNPKGQSPEGNIYRGGGLGLVLGGPTGALIGGVEGDIYRRKGVILKKRDVPGHEAIGVIGGVAGATLGGGAGGGIGTLTGGAALKAAEKRAIERVGEDFGGLDKIKLGHQVRGIKVGGAVGGLGGYAALRYLAGRHTLRKRQEELKKGISF